MTSFRWLHQNWHRNMS